MDFRLSDETLEWKDYCRKFASEVIRPAAPKHDREESVPYEVIKEAYQWNLAGIDWIMSLQNDPEGLKGVIYAEELHWGCAGIALAISASSLCAAGIASSGTPEQIGRWIPQVVGTKEEPRLGAYAVTEPQAGSDVKSLRTTAKRDGDDWILNGTKTFISNGGIADVTVIVATVDPELGHRGQASFVVTKDNPGLRLGQKESKLGIRASQTAEIVLDECRVPGDALLGGEEKLQKKLERARSGKRSQSSGALATFEITRPTVGASALGIAQAAYEWTLEHLSGRYDNGRPLLEEQRIQQVIADVATEIEAARLLVWRAAWMGRNGVPMTSGQGSMSKLKGGDVTMWATTTLMDLVGPEAQSTDCPLEKWFRDAKIYQIFEGTAQIQRLVIARMQAAEYAERLQYAKEVASTNGNAAVVSQAPGNAQSETPAASERQKVVTG
jgi:acyl-CoA dehydrogenase